MNTDLQKRLEEAAKEEMPNAKKRNGLEFYEPSYRCGFEHGAEHGYKEAIKQAKEWLKEQGKDWNEGYGVPFNISNFEADMNKLWEEKK